MRKSRKVGHDIGLKVVTEGASADVCHALGIPAHWATNPHAPPLNFLEKAFLPLINRMGPRVHVAMERAGFYPAGGGRWFVNIEPAQELSSLHLPERGEILRKQATAYVAGLPGEIAKRELERVGRLLNWTDDQRQIRQWPAEWGPGNLLTLEVPSEHVTEVFTGFGMKGVTAEVVAEDAVRDVRRYLAGGGSFQTQAPTRHTLTNIEVISRFLPIRVAASKVEESSYIIRVTPG